MATPDQTPLAAGMLFQDRYRIVRCMAAGGMGAVYECVHLTTQKPRALKVMLPQMLTAKGMRERFELEARVTANIDSEHIVETFDAGIDGATGSPFLVMELLKGEDLQNILRARGPFTPEETVVLLSQAALALDKTHAAGIVHRDLKPQNLFLTARDDGSPRLKILDFGIAKVVADGTKTAHQTAAIGTPVFMAPEQATGDGTIGPAADLFALGHIAYALLVGQAYWSEEVHALPVYAFLGQMLAGPVESATARAARHGVALPAGFDPWFARATARVPSHRFDHAGTQVAELAAALRTPRQLPSTPLELGPRLWRSSFAPALATPSAVAAASQPVASSSSAMPDAASALRAREPAPLATDAAAPPRVARRAWPVGVVVVTTVAAAAGMLIGVRAFQSASTDLKTAASQSATPVVVARAQAPSEASPPEVVAVAPVAPTDAAPPPLATTEPSTSASDRTRKPIAPAPRTPSASRSAAPATTPGAPKRGAVTLDAANCNPPFTLDASGTKRAKPECL